MGRLTESFSCPACHGPLDSVLEGASFALACPACGIHFPTLGQVPVLLPDPVGVLSTWRSRLAAFVTETEAIERHLWAELLEPSWTESTRRRLRIVAEAMPEHRGLILELFREVGLEPLAISSGEASSPLDYVTLIHRDFGWQPEVDEVTPALTRLLAVVPPGFQLGKTLVVGAGTARLAWDLGLHFGSLAPLVALDVNPLPLLVTQRLLRGSEVVLYELPGHPRRAELAAVRRTLRPPGPPPADLQLLIADGLHPPVPAESFDTVVTPWFLDQVPQDLATFLPEIRRVLRPGGSWLHTGPFVYAPAHTKPAHRYAVDEFLELVAQLGFEMTASTYEPAPYLCSPLSTQGRQERVLCLHATKKARVATEREPEWLGLTWAGAIPRLQPKRGAPLPLPILERILGLIDGRRGVAELTALLVAAGELADDGNAEAAVRGCLRVLWRASR